MILAIPSLQGLDLPSNVLRNPSATELGPCNRLVDLSVELRLVEPDRIDAMLDRIVGLVKLRRIHLKGHDRLGYGDRPNNADVERVAALPALKVLRLTDTPAVDEAVLDAIRRSRPGLAVVRKP
ncbi:MAG: hypothetical protein U0800_13445 [Isosphaeraceae bacterium]